MSQFSASFTDTAWTNNSLNKMIIQCMINSSISEKTIDNTTRCWCCSCLKIVYIWVPSESQVERVAAAEEIQTVKKPLDTSEPLRVLGWEVLEAEGAVTEKQAEVSLPAKEEESSGLVKAIVGVFHKG